MNKLILYIYLLTLVLILLVCVYFYEIFSGLPSPESLLEYTPTLSTKIYDINNELITELFTERRTWVPLTKIPVDLQNAIIAIEDHKFFHHWGISFRGIIRAAINNLIHRRFVAGGSTITQQLARVAFLTQERKISRKIRELLLAFELERNFSKQEILEMYLNQIYFGHGAYGVEQAAQVYFSKHTYELNLAECTILTGLIRYPSYYSPFNHPKRTIYRRQTVLSRMNQLAFITKHEELRANSEPIITERVVAPSYVAPYFIEYLRLLLEAEYGSESTYRSGWNIYTTLDLEMQLIAEEVIGEKLDEFDLRKLAELEDDFEVIESTEIKEVQCSLLVLDVKTGGIRTMIGGRDFRESQFNRAIQAYRQPGSAFKPIVYTAAIEKGYTPSTIIEDTPVVYLNDGHDWRLVAKTTDYLLELDPEIAEDPMQVWVPENYKNKYYGNVLLRKALEHSLNVCAVRTIEEIGTTVVIDYARRFGMKSPLINTYALALGASDLTLLELVSVYNVFANKGIRTEPYAVIRIENRNGRIVERNYPKEEEVLSEQVSYIITNLLRGVVENGTGRFATILERPCAGKTGTTNEFTDAWFIGYVPELICGVWVGYDDRTTLGEKKTGGAVACPVWTYFMKRILEDTPVTDFSPPSSGITYAEIDLQTGFLAANTNYAYTEVFLKGTEPKTVAISTTTDFMFVPLYEDTTGF